MEINKTVFNSFLPKIKEENCAMKKIFYNYPQLKPRNYKVNMLLTKLKIILGHRIF